MPPDAQDTAAVESVDDHTFEVRPNEPWATCQRCGLAEAAHKHVNPVDSYANHMAWKYGEGVHGSA